MDQNENYDVQDLWDKFRASVLQKSPLQFENFHKYFMCKYTQQEVVTSDIEEAIV